MRYIVKFLIGILNTVYFIIKLFPVGNKITIVSRQSDKKSLDISMLEEEIKRQRQDIKVYVLCRSFNGGISRKILYAFHLLRQMWHIGTSKAVVTDSYSIGISALKQRENLKVIQMWHALGALKKFGFSIAGNNGEGRDSMVAKIMGMHKNYTNIIISSEACEAYYKEAFGYDNVEMNIAALPRVDALRDKVLKEKATRKIYEKYPKLKDKEIIVYAPTFRVGKNITEQMEELNNSINKDKYNLVIKNHPLMEEILPKEGMILDETFSTMEMLFVADYVICDYSAVVYEAAVIEKPLFFYAFDLEEYKGRRDFYLDYEKEMPGIVSTDSREIAQAIERKEFSLDKVRAFSDKYIANKEKCTQRLAKIVLE